MNTECENAANMSECALASLILPNLILPALNKTEKDDPTMAVSKSNIKNVFTKIDALLPNFTYEFINELIKLNETKNINMNEMILRSEKFVSSEGKKKTKIFEIKIYLNFLKRVFYQAVRI